MTTPTATRRRPRTRILLAVILSTLLSGLVAACASYRPGVDGSRPVLPQNAPSNSEPQPPGSRPR